MKKSDLHEYQRFAVEHIMTHPSSGLFISMGLGKTATTLTAIDRLLFDQFEISRVIVIAPKKVAEDTWKNEIELWDHLKHLKISIVLGSERQRKEALRTKADLYIINRENTAWLVAHYQSAWPFDMLVIDELSSFKSAKSVRFKALRTVRPKIKRVVGLTGTPAPNGYMDLWSELYLLDQGERLGKTISSYRDKYFNPGKRNGHVVFNYSLKTAEAEKEITDKISDICISMKAKDYLKLPERIDTISWITFPDELQEKYNSFEKKLILHIDGEEGISPANAAGLTNKLIQFCSGAVYDADKNWHEIHTEKLDVLEERVEAANGEPMFIAYHYQHDLERILKRLKAFKPVVLTGSEDMKRWNKRDIPVYLGHPMSAAHGLNLQHGGHLTEWFGLQWGAEFYEQFFSRLDRQGQLKPVINNRILVRNTMDEKVLRSLEGKISKQDAVMEAVKALIKKYRA